MDINLPGLKGYCTGWVVKAPSEAPVFAEPGDSGALVWTRYGKWCGLLFGANPVEETGYYIPAKVVEEDVMAVAQGKLILPGA